MHPLNPLPRWSAHIAAARIAALIPAPGFHGPLNLPEIIRAQNDLARALLSLSTAACTCPQPAARAPATCTPLTHSPTHPLTQKP